MIKTINYHNWQRQSRWGREWLYSRLASSPGSAYAHVSMTNQRKRHAVHSDGLRMISKYPMSGKTATTSREKKTLASRSDICCDVTDSTAMSAASRSEAYCLLVRKDSRCDNVWRACCDGLHDDIELLLPTEPAASQVSRNEASLGIWAARNAAIDFATKRNLKTQPVTIKTAQHSTTNNQHFSSTLSTCHICWQMAVVI